jgi:glycosyltransferase involved in cell wall biosynthesis
MTPLPLGVDTTVFTPKRHSGSGPGAGLPRPVVGYVGDLLPARDVPLLVDAVALCGTPAGLLVVGDGPSRPELERLAKKHGLHGRARFTGQVPHAQVPDYLNSMDVLVLPSRAVRNRYLGIFQIANAEQFGRVLVEAMACGKPVVGSSCGEIPNVIGDAGRVYPEGNREALAAVLEALCADEGLREGLGRAALARARACYEWRAIARRFLSAVRGMLGPRPAATQDGVRPASGSSHRRRRVSLQLPPTRAARPCRLRGDGP